MPISTFIEHASLLTLEAKVTTVIGCLILGGTIMYLLFNWILKRLDNMRSAQQDVISAFRKAKMESYKKNMNKARNEVILKKIALIEYPQKN